MKEKDHWLRKWLYEKCIEAPIIRPGTCRTPDGDIEYCSECRYLGPG